MRSSLALSIVDASGRATTLTDRVSGLSWTKRAIGGWTALQFKLNAPYTFRIDSLSYVRVTDARTGAVVMDGYTDQPGQAYDGAEGYDVSAAGGESLASDLSRALLFIDSDLGSFDDYSGADPGYWKSGNASVTSHPDEADTEVVLCQYEAGTPTGTSWVGLEYLSRAVQPIGAYSVQSIGGGSQAGYERQTNLAADVVGYPFTTGYATHARTSAHFGTSATRLLLLARRTGADTTPTGDRVWAAFRGARVKGLLKDRYGDTVTGTTSAGVSAAQVVGDVVGRLLPSVDPSTAVIESGSASIDQLTYENARAADVLSDLTVYEPDFIWGIGGKTGAGHEFWWRRWPTQPRYEITDRDGLELTGQEGGDLANEVTVSWTTGRGRPRSRVVTSTVPELDAIGRTISLDPLTLPDGQGSVANADLLGAAVLAQHSGLRRSGRAVIARPIRDLVSGGTVQPWEIRPGELAVIRSTGDTLPVSEVTYDDDTAAATLTLGRPARSFEQILRGVPGGRR